MKELLLIAVGSALVNNVVLSQFLGICPFLGVSKNVKTAAGMGGAVVFVITISSFVTGLIYQFILVPLHFEYLQTIVFILVIAALVQFVEMFLKKAMPLLPPNIPNPMEKAIKEEIVEKKIPADLIVLAMGGKADETFFFEAGEEHLAKEIYNIGDSSRAGRVLEAVRGAYHLAVRI